MVQFFRASPALLILVVAACSGDPSVECGSTTCSSGQVCVDDVCVTPCNRSADCGPTQLCAQGVCRDTECGDGVLEGAEECDAGIANADSASCTTRCTVARCGDGLIQTGVEACDDGNDVDTDACVACEVAECGDGSVQTGVEECDDGNDVETDACLSTCFIATCGDGVIQAGVEECDNGLANANTAQCTAGCLDQVCGDGFLGPQEGCDDNNLENNDGCDSNCVLETCGNGMDDPGEECDDQNAIDTDGCLSNCRLPSCGDGAVWAGQEDCDDGNGVLTDACPDGALGTCEDAVCGDGFRQSGVEGCDDGDLILTDDCPDGPTGTCEPARCGDGFQQNGVEGCDDGDLDLTDACPDGPTGTCEPARCGDGFEQNGVEGCDDGNSNNSDICPDGPMGTCQPATCGDGHVRALAEQCDDGNSDNTDSCPDGPGGTCFPATCGDGFVYAGVESCDTSMLPACRECRLVDADLSVTGTLQANTTPDVGLGTSGEFVVAWFDDEVTQSTALHFDDSATTGFSTAQIGQSPRVDINSAGLEIFGSAAATYASAAFMNNGSTTGVAFGSGTLAAQAEVALVMDELGRAVLVWDQHSVANMDLGAMIVDDQGSLALNTFFDPPSTTATNPDVAAASENFVVVWQGEDGTSGDLHVWAQRMNSAGTVGQALQVSTSTVGNSQPSVGMASDSSFVVAWREQQSPSRIMLRRFTWTASAGAPFPAAANTGMSERAPDISVSGLGEFVVVWEADGLDGDGAGVAARRFSSSDEPQRNEYLVNYQTSGDQTRPAVSLLNDGRFVVVWDEQSGAANHVVKGQRIDTDNATINAGTPW